MQINQCQCQQMRRSLLLSCKGQLFSRNAWEPSDRKRVLLLICATVLYQLCHRTRQGVQNKTITQRRRLTSRLNWSTYTNGSCAKAAALYLKYGSALGELGGKILKRNNNFIKTYKLIFINNRVLYSKSEVNICISGLYVNSQGQSMPDCSQCGTLILLQQHSQWG